MSSDRSGDAAGHLRLALSTSIVGGALLGLREGLGTFVANAFADPGHYLLAYLAVPIAVWLVLAPAITLPLAALARLVGVVPRLPLYAATLAAVGTALAVVPWLGDGVARMRATGVEPGVGVFLALAVPAVVLIAAAASLAGAAAAWHARQTTRPLALAVCLAALVGALAIALTASVVVQNVPTLGIVSAAVAARGATRPDLPNVVLVSVDTLRADALGSYGNPSGSTPALDRLAAGGVTFRNAITASPWTLPAVASLMTGLYPRHHGAGAVQNRHDPLGRAPLSAELWTLSQALAAAGYETKAIVTNPYLLARSGLAAGFHNYDNLTFLSEAMLAGRSNAGQWLVDRLLPQLTVGDRGVEVSDRAVRWLATADAGRPFFLWLHFIDPHGPYSRGDGSRRKSFRGETTFGADRPGTDHLDAISPEPVRLRSGEVRLDANEKERVRGLYRGEVAEVDRQVGRVLDALEHHGLAERTLVICVSDHGEEFWEHGGVEHGHTTYDELLRIVLIMRWPGRLPAATRIDGLASIIDVAPTLLELLGLEGAPSLDGRSLVALLRGEADPERAVVAENLLFAEERVALRTPTQKYVRWANGKEEVYDLVHDEAERRDLAGLDDVVAPLRERLARIESSIPSRVPSSGEAGLAPSAAALHALGYVH